MAPLIMENHPLLLGLKSRLESVDFKLKDKLSLISNLYKSGVTIPYKDSVILEWILNTLDQKYSDANVKKKDVHKVWSLLETCLEHVLETRSKVHLNFDKLLNLADKADLHYEPTVHCFNAILVLQANQNSSAKEVFDLCHKLVQKEYCPPNVLDVLLDKVQQCRGFDFSRGSFLAHASRHCGPENTDKLTALCMSVIFNSPDSFQEFFSHLHDTDEKYVGSSGVQLFLEYLSNGGDAGLVLNSTRDVTISAELRTKLFILYVHMSGQQQYSDKEALLLAKIEVSMTTRPDLKNVILNSLPLNADYLHITDKSKNLTVVTTRILCEAVIEVVDSEGMTEETMKVLQEVHAHHPTVLETLAPLIVTRCLKNDSETCHKVFSLIVDLMLKLRQFPKLVSKLLLYLRNNKLDVEVTLDGQFCDAIDRAVMQIPRVQNLEVWKILNYHLATDFIPKLGEDDVRSKNYWSLCAPILSAVLRSGQLLDHNVPEPLVVRIKDLINTTFSDVLVKPDQTGFSDNSRILYEILVADFLEFVHILGVYKNLEFPEITEFKTNLLSKILKSKEIGQYGKLIEMELKSHSKHELEIMKVFRVHLAKSPWLLHGVGQDVLFEADHVDDQDDMDCEEDPSWCALRLQTIFSDMSKQVGDYVKLADKKIWSETTDWSSRESVLCSTIVTEIKGLLERDPKEVSNVDLTKLPVENLPAVLQLAVTLVSLHCDISSPSQHACVMLARSLHDTHIFRYIDSTVLMKKLLDLEIEVPACLLDRLSRELTRYQKMLTELEAGYSSFSSEIQEGRMNYVHMFTLLLGRLVNLSTEVHERKQTAHNLSSKILKSLMKMAKHEMSSRELPYHVRSAIAIVQMDTELEGKVEKYFKKVLAATVNTEAGLELVQVLLTTSQDKFKQIINLDHLTAAWKVVLGTELKEEEIKVATLILNYLEPDQVATLLEGDSTYKYKIVRVLISMKLSDDQQDVKDRLETMLMNLLQDESISEEDKVKLIVYLSDARLSPVSVGVEAAALSLVMSLPGQNHFSAQTAQVLNAFVRNHPNGASKYSPVVVEAARSHIRHVARSDVKMEDEEADLGVCTTLLVMFNTFKKKKSDWGSLAPYLVGDLMTALLTVSSQRVKQSLVACAHALLSISEDYTHEYISANLPSAANEMFKLVLQDYKVNYKFTGRDI